MSAFRTNCLLIVAVAFVVTFGCDARVPPGYGEFASTQFPDGNRETKEFLTWTKTRHPEFCSVQLDRNGDIVELTCHPCYPVKNDELWRISALKEIRSLTICGSTTVTNDGLRFLASMPKLKQLTLYSTKSIGDAELARFQDVRPEIAVDTPCWRGP